MASHLIHPLVAELVEPVAELVEADGRGWGRVKIRQKIRSVNPGLSPPSKERNSKIFLN